MCDNTAAELTQIIHHQLGRKAEWDRTHTPEHLALVAKCAAWCCDVDGGEGTKVCLSPTVARLLGREAAAKMAESMQGWAGCGYAYVAIRDLPAEPPHGFEFRVVYDRRTERARPQWILPRVVR